MRAGNLRHRATILSLSADLSPVDHGSRWVSLRAKDAGDVTAPTGLRSAGLVEVRARYTSELQQGRYLRNGNRLLYIASAPRDPMGTKAEMVMSCAELVGAPAAFIAQVGAAPLPCRAFMVYEVERPGQFAGVVEYVTQLEAAVIEVGRPQPGAVFEVDGVAWRVAGLVEGEDDRVVRRMWVKRV